MRIISDCIKPTYVFIIGDRFKIMENQGVPIYDELDTIELSDDDWCEIYRGFEYWLENKSEEELIANIQIGVNTLNFPTYLKELIQLARIK